MKCFPFSSLLKCFLFLFLALSMLKLTDLLHWRKTKLIFIDNSRLLQLSRNWQEGTKIIEQTPVAWLSQPLHLQTRPIRYFGKYLVHWVGLEMHVFFPFQWINQSKTVGYNALKVEIIYLIRICTARFTVLFICVGKTGDGQTDTE